MGDTDLSNEAAITEVLESIGSVVGSTSRGYVHASCPLAKYRHEGGVDKNPSFGVVYSSAEARKEEGHAHCFSCGYSGDVREIASLLHVWGDLTVEELSGVMTTMEKVKTGNLPLSLSSHHHEDDPFVDPDWLTSFPKVTPAHEAAMDYLTGRGITDDMIDHFDLRFDPTRYRIVLPLYDRAQRCRGVIGRTLIKDPMGPRYFYYPYKKHPPKGFTWPNENHLDLSKPVLVVEGFFDVMKCWPVYPNCTASLSIAFRKPGMGWMNQVSRWVTMFDNGKGGAMARTRLADMVGKSAKVWHLDPPPGRDDPGDATPEEILAKLQTLN
jgi:DNA primase